MFFKQSGWWLTDTRFSGSRK